MFVTLRLVWVAVAAAAVAVVLALILPMAVALLIGVTSVVALAAIDVVAARASLTVTRAAAAAVTVGESTTSIVQLHNSGAAVAQGTVFDNWPPSVNASEAEHAFVIPPGDTVAVATQLRPTRAGDRHAGPVIVRTTGPWRLAGVQRRVDLLTVIRVNESVRDGELVHTKVSSLRWLEGANPTTIRGTGTDFDSVRAYVPGDDVRSIDWRATARSHDVMTRIWRPEHDRHVLLIIDTGRRSAVRIGDKTQLDIAAEAAMVVGGLATAAGDTVDVLGIDREIRVSVRGIRGARALSSVGAAVAPLRPHLITSDPGAVVREVFARPARRAIVIWFTSLDPGSAGPDRVATEGVSLSGAARTLARRHQVIVVAATDPTPTPSDLRRRAVLAAGGRDLELVRKTLQRSGVTVVSAAPQRLPLELVAALQRVRLGASR
ncbi:DUF58 domain-containing protein [Williamsia sp. CHRR-6]|uniref:DUF58 domain-containing protein n=1 Tax=Williamsia sp. CHRR-6 TaxID=2835871 RepID=UPI001BDA851A|nr:DUF58 domain-containing protein [Williamsia sp. CHRR-6]MBT0565733.1 DUF58 domain-containing protein [Williamsia sp. CHRR-6]